MSSSPRTRATRAACSSGMGSRRGCSYHEHNEAARVAQLVPRLERVSASRSSQDAGCRRTPVPAPGSCSRRSRRGSELTVLTRRVFRRGGAASLQRARRRPLRVRRFSGTGKGGRATALWRENSRWEPGRSWRSKYAAAPACGAPLVRRGIRIPRGRIAVCRELTKRFEEIARGSAADLADALRRAARRVRSHHRLRPGVGRVRSRRGSCGRHAAGRRRNALGVRGRRRCATHGELSEPRLYRGFSVTIL